MTYPLLPPGRRKTVAYIGAYPPSNSPSAMFTLDLVNATDLHGWQSVVVAAVNSTDLQWLRDNPLSAAAWRDRKVAAMLVADEPATFERAARALRREEISAACLHLAAGVYGPAAASSLAQLAAAIECPLAVAVHSVDAEPEPEQLRCVRELIPFADVFVVMTHAAKAALSAAYGVPAAKLHYIPYGTPFIEFSDEASASAKSAVGLAGRRVLASFGALRPGRGIDDALVAMPGIVREHPDVIYVVLCPEVTSANPNSPGESRTEKAFRLAGFDRLRGMVEAMALQEHVRFVREALPMQRRIDYLAATDIFIDAEHADRGKSASATLAYAFAAGNLIVATPTPHARDLLAQGRGYLYPFRDAAALARRICAVLDDLAEFRAVRERAYAYGRGMTWEDVGLKYVELFDDLARRHAPGRGDERSHLRFHRGHKPTMLWEKAHTSIARSYELPKSLEMEMGDPQELGEGG